MARLMITKKGVHYAVSDKDFSRVSQYNWELRSCGYLMATIKGKPTLLHRFIMNPPKGLIVDHKNGLRTDCTRPNLRLCTYAQNAQNRFRAVSSTGYKGVSTHPKTSKFKAQIRHGGKLLHLGYYATKIEAAKAYDAKALELFGEFANLNFKEPK